MAVKKTLYKLFIAVCGAVMLVTTGVAGYYDSALPDSFYVTKGTSLKLATRFGITVSSAEQATTAGVAHDSVRYSAETVSLKLFGVIPVKEVTVEEVEAPTLVAGGNPFGIKLLCDGVVVVDLEEIVCGDKRKCPAKESGIKSGDIIISVNGEKITSNEKLSEMVSGSCGEELAVRLLRKEKILDVLISPVFCTDDDTFKVGVYTRDSSAGIGTVTFFNPQNNTFGGLGHPICDADTGGILPLSSGEVVSVNISGYNVGTSGKPGELIGSFSSSFSAGELFSNSTCGVFGKLNYAPNLSAPVPLAFKQEIREGPATVLTTISGKTPQEYSIEIEKIDFNSDSTKNMVIHVTDEDLQGKTGGILQGMSGSPILQNGKLVGAVTHVFVNDPSRGYAVFAETMYDESCRVFEQSTANNRLAKTMHSDVTSPVA